MEQRNDGSPWYPVGGYVSDPSTYTLPWTSLSAGDKSAFAASFATTHYWRLTCSDAVGRSTSRTWSLQKSSAFPTVVDATLNLNCATPPPSISVQCANSDYYAVTDNTTNAVIGSGAGTAGTVVLPNVDATYRVTCKQGGAGGTPNTGQYLRTYNASMCTTQATSFTATPRTIKSGSVSTLQWSINQPSAACSLVAAPVCLGTCSQTRIDNVTLLNNELLNGYTDANDPNNVNGELRKVIDAIQKEAFNNGISGKGLGKKSLRINNTTDFIINCGTPQKVRVQVTNDTEA
jgi:hypothetical protein